MSHDLLVQVAYFATLGLSSVANQNAEFALVQSLDDTIKQKQLDRVEYNSGSNCVSNFKIRRAQSARLI